MHLSGTGIGDLGDIAFMPVLNANGVTRNSPMRAERVRPGYYSLMLDKSGIRVELHGRKARGHASIQVPADVKEGYIVLNLKQGIGWDRMATCGFKQESPIVISGYRHSGLGQDQRIVYFTAMFSQPVKLASQEGDSIGVFTFPNNNTPILVKVGISGVSAENARMNIDEEIPAWDFQRHRGCRRPGLERPTGQNSHLYE